MIIERQIAFAARTEIETWLARLTTQGTVGRPEGSQRLLNAGRKSAVYVDSSFHTRLTAFQCPTNTPALSPGRSMELPRRAQ